MKDKLEKYGTFGAIVAAAACPICFPKLALIGALVGFGALAPYEIIFFYAAQILVLVALVGNYLAFSNHKNKAIFALAVCSVVLFFVSLYVLVNEYLSYVAILGMVTAVILQIVESRKCQSCEG